MLPLQYIDLILKSSFDTIDSWSKKVKVKIERKGIKCFILFNTTFAVKIKQGNIKRKPLYQGLQSKSGLYDL